MGTKTFICPICVGKGYNHDHIFGVFTLGIAYLFDMTATKCTRCKGTGFVTIKED